MTTVNPTNTDLSPRCWNCKKLLGTMLTRPWSMVCPRCKTLNERHIGELGRRQGSIEQKGEAQ